MEVGLVRRIDIDDEMQQSYLDYAMSVIVARALPDARDGLKPVHRRILFAMHDMGLHSDTPYKKSARIVGEVLGKYHPHGDAAVYESMVRMAQDFSMRYLLVDGQGNFGSIDGDPAAAMRYTEARLAPLTTHMLADIHKNTVNFVTNFDGSLSEPVVLPAAFPNLLVNGATGIAVGMATSIPPHNLGEVIEALFFMLEKWDTLDDISVEDLMRFIKGPDFPTGGVIIQEAHSDSLAGAYATGRGRVTVQARVHLEDMSRGRNRILITELPYMTNKASLIERIAALVRDGKLEGVADLRDESDRQGMRVVIEIAKTADPQVVLQELYKETPLRSTISMIILALVDGEPRMLGLKQVLRVYLEHRLDVVRRRSEFELDKARQRAHILEGLRIALNHLDEVIALIKRAPDVETARMRLVKRFRLSEIQAQSILDMQLRRLAALERKKIEDEYKELKLEIKRLESLLRSPQKMRLLVSEELKSVKNSYADSRRTQIIRLKVGEKETPLLPSSELLPEESIWVIAATEGLLSRTSGDKLPRMSGKDSAKSLVKASSRDTLYLVTENGEAVAIPAQLLPIANKPSEGIPYFKVSELSAQQSLAALFAAPGREAQAENIYVLTVTRQGMVKKSLLKDLPGPSAHTFTIAKVNSGDRLGWVQITNGEKDILLISRSGKAIRFNEREVRAMGLIAGGVTGIKLQAKDELVGAEIIPEKGEVLLVATDGTAKRMGLSQFPQQGRNGQGVIAWKLPRGVEVAGMVIGKGTTSVTINLSEQISKSFRLDDVVAMGRSARGKRLLELKGGSQIIGTTVPWEVPGFVSSVVKGTRKPGRPRGVKTAP